MSASGKSTIERAFEIASSGAVGTMRELEQALSREGRDTVTVELAGRTLRTQLRERILAARPDEAAKREARNSAKRAEKLRRQTQAEPPAESPSEAAVRARAHDIWEETGRPTDQADLHWEMAKKEIEQRESAPPSQPESKDPQPRRVEVSLTTALKIIND
jgi:hypothetical protein